MPRDSQGLYTLPPGNPVIPGTVIESDWANETLTDVGDALTGSLPRSGAAPMTGLLTLAAASPTNPRHAASKAYVDQFVAFSTGMPIGSIVAFAAGVAPGGFLLCNGQAVSRTTYSALFSLIGTSFGAGDGLTTFNVPNIQDQFIRGRGTGRTVGSTQSDATRSHTHSISDPGHTHTASSPTHTHTTDAHTHSVTDPGHSHTTSITSKNNDGISPPGFVVGGAGTLGTQVFTSTTATTGVTVGSSGVTVQAAGTTTTIDSAVTGVTVGAVGDTETRPQNIAFDYYIKALQDSAGPVPVHGITSSDENMIAIDSASPSFPNLVIKSNIAFGTVKLDGGGKVPVAVMPFTTAAYLGYFDASTNENPSEKFPATNFNSGDFYLIAVPGTINVFDPVTLVSSPTAVAVGDTVSFVENSATNPTGWYKSAAATAVSASAVTLIPVGGISATNVQAAVAELDSEKAPTSAGTAVGTSFTPAGSISAVNVQAALEELDADIALKQNAVTAVQKTSNTGSAITPNGTTAERDVTPFFGYFRANSSLVALEWWNGSAWMTVGDVTLNGMQTLTNKTVALGSNTVSGTKAQFDTACTDGDFAFLNSASTFTASQRGTVTTDNDLSFDLSVTNNFKCTPSAGGALTFTNHTAGQSGFVLLVNGSNYAITAAATTKISAADLTKISATGTYLISYFDDGTNTYCVTSGSLA